MMSKPLSLESLFVDTERMFRILQGTFGMSATISIDLSSVDSAARTLQDPYYVAAFTMQRLQSLRHVSSPETNTSPDVAIGACSDLVGLIDSILAHDQVLGEDGVFLRDETRYELSDFQLKLHEVGQELVLLLNLEEQATDRPIERLRGSRFLDVSVDDLDQGPKT